MIYRLRPILLVIFCSRDAHAKFSLYGVKTLIGCGMVAVMTLTGD